MGGVASHSIQPPGSATLAKKFGDDLQPVLGEGWTRHCSGDDFRAKTISKFRSF